MRYILCPNATPLWGLEKFGEVSCLKCRECGKEYPVTIRYACDDCFGPVDVVYNYDTLQIRKETIEKRPKNLWRYLELLPIRDESRIVSLGAGYTTLHRAHNLGRHLGLRNLYLKDDTVNPTYSFKDRPASVAVSKALEFGAAVVGCASTGNLAGATAAHAAKADLPCYIFVPRDLEPNKMLQMAAYGAHIIAVNGTYDDANRLATQAAEQYNWALVNINIRPFYVEGSKTLAYEVCEQLDWTPPSRVIVPTASGALLCAIQKGFEEFYRLRLMKENHVKICGAQPLGCSPIVAAFRNGTTEIAPVEHPDTIAKSLAIGDPADGAYAVKAMKDTGGVAEASSDDEIVDAMQLLAKTEGIFSEPAGGVVVAVLRKLVNQGEIDPSETVVCYITGNGLKTAEAFSTQTAHPILAESKL
ncbi:MAG: threonine synthase, partial [Candidatus Bathyarchaeia archaeon]